jgi:formylglycine-generating enzyme required for sulfatase activity
MRRAFVMGSNGPSNLAPLRYALKDAENLRASLSTLRSAFAVSGPEPGADVFAVRQSLYAAAESCQEQDTFVCYFSGHGFLDQGSLFLLWDNSEVERLLSTALPVEAIILALQRCKAQNRLLILDCCHAGAVASAVGFKDAGGIPVAEMGIKPSNYLVLMAAERLERARELEELQGSFLTAKLCDALDASFQDADIDGDGVLSIADLKSWLEQEVQRFNRYSHSGGPVATPYFFGQLKGNFFLTLRLSDWRPYEIQWPDDSRMVVLPIRPRGLYAICLSKHPVTIGQYQRLLDAFPVDPATLQLYQRFVEECPTSTYLDRVDSRFQQFHNPLSVPCQEPVGVHYHGSPLSHMKTLRRERLRDLDFRLFDRLEDDNRADVGSWQRPFYPLREPGFMEPDKPVVCVTVREARKYCAWINEQLSPPGKTFLPKTTIWDFAAFGKPFPIHSSDAWLSQLPKSRTRHHPPAIDESGANSNSQGICDLFETVWQWCSAAIPMHTHSSREVMAKLRGGGFMSDLTHEEPYWDSAYLDSYEETRRSDIGFRIAARVPLDALPEHVRDSLSVCQPVDLDYLHDEYRGWPS